MSDKLTPGQLRDLERIFDSPDAREGWRQALASIFRDEAARREADGGIPADHLKHSLDTMPEAAKAFVKMANELPDAPKLSAADEALLFKGVEEALTGPKPPLNDTIFLDGHRYVYQPDAPPPPAPDDLVKRLRLPVGVGGWQPGALACIDELTSRFREAANAIEDLLDKIDGLDSDYKNEKERADKLAKERDYWFDLAKRAHGDALAAVLEAKGKLRAELIDTGGKMVRQARRAEAAEEREKRLREALEKMLEADDEDFDGRNWWKLVEQARAALAQGGNDDRTA